MKIIKKSNICTIIAIQLLISVIIFPVSGTAASKFTAGMTVAAKWLDDNYYLAKIKNVGNGEYEIEYADGAQGFLAEGSIKEIPVNVVLTVGDKVLAVWPGGTKLYSGTVQEIRVEGAVIIWDDGSSASMVEFGKIIKK